MILIKKYWTHIGLIVSTLAITIALVAEHIFNIIPCQMCLYQRYVYYFIIFISLFYLFIKKISLSSYYKIASLSFLIGMLLSLWHVGIEQKILPGLAGCSGAIDASLSISELKQKILSQNIVACDEIVWSFMGLSAATYSSLLMIALFIINTIFLFQEYNEKEKKI